MPSEWRIGRYKSGDEIQILTLFETVFRRKRSLQHWNTLYTENPAGNRQIVVARDQQDNIIGHVATIPNACKWKQYCLNIALVADLMVHPAYRGPRQGHALFEELTKALVFYHLGDGKNALIFSLPNFVAAKSGRNSKFGNAEHYQQNINYLFGNRNSLTADNREGSGIYRTLELNLVCMESLAEWVRGKHGRKANSQDLSIIKDYSYLTWRYHPNLDYDYQAVEFVLGGQSVGAVVLAISPYRGHDSVAIVDWLIIDQSEDISRAVIGKLLDYVGDSGFDNLVTLFPVWSYEYRIFRCYGFRPESVDRILSVLFTSDSQVIDIRCIQNCWNYRFADFDIC